MMIMRFAFVAMLQLICVRAASDHKRTWEHSRDEVVNYLRTTIDDYRRLCGVLSPEDVKSPGNFKKVYVRIDELTPEDGTLFAWRSELKLKVQNNGYIGIC